MKKFICILFCSILFHTSCFAFNDINVADLKVTIDDLVSFGIISGYEDGSFRPDNNITRAEFSKMIVCATGYNYFECKIDSSFVDVNHSHWSKDYIYISKRLGIVNGISDTTFEPESNITYEQAIKMIICSLGYGELAIEKGGYPNGYMQVAFDLGILEGLDFVQVNFATRKDIALIINKALDIKYNYMYEFENKIYIDESPLTLREMHNMRISNVFVNDELEQEGNDEYTDLDENAVG